MNTFFLGHGATKSVDGYKINLYRYGELWKVITVDKGSSVVIGACDVAYDDDTFYGWSTVWNSVARTYTSTSRITPTSDINLYAIFSYQITNATIIQRMLSTSLSTETSTTLTVSDALAGYGYTVTTSASIPKSTVVNYGSYSVYSISSDTFNEVIASGTATSSTISYTFSAYTDRTVNLPSGTTSPTSVPTMVTLKSPTNVTGAIQYYSSGNVTGNYYRVVSHDNPSVINLYKYGELYESYGIQEGLSITVGKIESEYSDDTFYGWSLSPDSTTRTYSSDDSVTPHGELNLYAVYSYITGTEVTYSSGSITGTPRYQNSGTNSYESVTVTAGETGSVSATATVYTSNQYTSYSNPMSVSSSISSSGTMAYLSTTYVTKGGRFVVAARSTLSSANGYVTTNSVTVSYRYPSGLKNVLGYRVISHD